MVTNRNEALEGLRNGELTLAEIAIDLRTDSEIAIEAIKQYGESAITFLTATNSLPHTPEVFLTMLETTRTNISDKIKENSSLTLDGLKGMEEEEDIDKLMELNFDLSADLANVDAAIEKLTLYKEKILQKEPEKGGQEH